MLTVTVKLREALQFTPTHDLAKLSLTDLKKHPSVKDLYDELFKGRPELLNEESVVSAVKSRLLNYAEDSGQVRDSVADVRMKHMLPAIPTTATSLQIKKEGEFDRMLLVVSLSSWLSIPSAFFKSLLHTEGSASANIC